MEHPGFFERAAPFRLQALAEKVGAQLAPGRRPRHADPRREAAARGWRGRTLLLRQPQVSAPAAGDPRPRPAWWRQHSPIACPRAPRSCCRRRPIAASPWRCSIFYPDALTPKAAMAASGEPPMHPTAKLEEGVRIEPGAVIGREAQIGRGTTVAAGAVVGYRVTVGRGCYIGPGASVTHALVGDRVILHAGVQNRAGRVRLRDGRRRPPQGAAGRPGHHPGRRGDRGQQLRRSRRS